MLVAGLTVGQTQFHQRAVTISLVMIIVTCEAPAHRGKSTVFLTELVVGIDTGLQGVQTLGSVIRVLLEGFHMVVAQVTTQAPFRRQLEILAQTIEHGSRELRVETHEVGSHTKNVIGATVTIAHSNIRLGR